MSAEATYAPAFKPIGGAVALPSLKQLQYLVALHEHQHFGRAAEACNVTQSTLSAGLKELEAVLRMRLVERNRRTVVFTPVGLTVVRRADDLLLRARDLSLVRDGDGPTPSGTMRLSLIPTIAPFLLPCILHTVRTAYPDLQIQIHEEMSHQGCAGLSNGARDCMLLALPFECGDFEYAPLFEDPIVVAMHRNDPLAALSAVDPDDLRTDRLLLLHEGHCLRDHALRACRRSTSSASAAPGASLPTLIQLVDAAMGVTLLPAMAVESGVLEGTNVVVRPLASEDARRTIALAWRRHSPRSQAYGAFAMKIEELCGRKRASGLPGSSRDAHLVPV
jgi:LysR family hydrogen peroxide-inducible transcriptional activator